MASSSFLAASLCLPVRRDIYALARTATARSHHVSTRTPARLSEMHMDEFPTHDTFPDRCRSRSIVIRRRRSIRSTEAVTRRFGTVVGSASSAWRKATFPANASRSSKSFPSLSWPSKFWYVSRTAGSDTTLTPIPISDSEGVLRRVKQ